MTTRIGALIETALYVDDLQRSIAFYERVLGLLPATPPLDRLCALRVNDDQVLLLFTKGGSTEPVVTPFGIIPPNDGDGTLHIALSIPSVDFDAWQERLDSCGVVVESVVAWPEGGRSIYFRDPDQHLIELKTSNWFGKLLG